MNKLYALLATAILLLSCTSSQDVVQDGIFQQRKYIKKGWFIDLPRKDDPAPSDKSQEGSLAKEEEVLVTPPSRAEVLVEPLPPIEEELIAETSSVQAEGMVPEEDPGPEASLSDVPAEGSLDRPAMGMLRNGMTDPGPAQDDVGGINLFAVLGFIFAFLVPIAGLVLSIIGLNQTSPGGGNGHGLALAGLIISIVVLAIWLGVAVGPE